MATWFRSSKVGVVALGALLLGFVISFAFAGTVWNSFFDAAIMKSLPFRVVQAAMVLMFASVILAIWALWADTRKTTAIVVLLAFIPLFVLDVMRTGW